MNTKTQSYSQFVQPIIETVRINMRKWQHTVTGMVVYNPVKPEGNWVEVA